MSDQLHSNSNSQSPSQKTQQSSQSEAKINVNSNVPAVAIGGNSSAGSLPSQQPQHYRQQVPPPPPPMPRQRVIANRNNSNGNGNTSSNINNKNINNNSNNNSNSNNLLRKNNDGAAKDAQAMAALAQAASASGKSPAEAAEIAKAHAQSISKKQHPQQHSQQMQMRQQQQQQHQQHQHHQQKLRHQQQQQQHQHQQQKQQQVGHRRGPGQQAPAPTVRPEPRKIQPVPLESVKSLLRSEIAANIDSSKQHNTDHDGASSSTSSSSNLLQKLANGENDSFLQQVLLMEYLKDSETATKTTENGLENSGTGSSASEIQTQTDTTTSNNYADQVTDDAKSENWKTTFACERVKFLLRQIEMAYDTMEGMLPKTKMSPSGNDTPIGGDASFGGDGYDLDDDLDVPVVIPDFLPPCTSKRGDNTLEFFRACSGETRGEDDNGIIGDDPVDALIRQMEKADGSSIQNQHQQQRQRQQQQTKEEGHDDGDSKSAAYSESGATLSTSESSDTNASSNNASSSLFSSMFGMRRPSMRGGNRSSFLSSFSKRNRKGPKLSDEEGAGNDNGNALSGLSDYQCKPGEYYVIIEREMLGLTVENVLERTVVRTVLETGPAKKAGAKVGSLIVKVGNIETKNLTHFETIDELRQSQRPLLLVLRQIPEEALRAAREEMGRLIRGSGFGRIIDGEGGPNANVQPMQPEAGKAASIKNISLYSGLVRKRWIEAVNLTPRSKKCEPILRVGEKLIWIMTLFVVGLEREAERLFELAKEDGSSSSLSLNAPSVAVASPRSQHSHYHHSAQDYADAAKSASKVLYDFVKNRMDPSQLAPPVQPAVGMGGRGPRGGPMHGRGGRGGRGRGGRGMGVPGMGGGQPNLPPNLSSDKLLLQIGDVLHRMRTFLADPMSPPAAMMRGELIACLCDILDADIEMKLSEEENFSSTQGGNAGPIADLGAAGSLLKLIVLNCPIMRSPECEEIAEEDRNIDKEEMARRVGEKKDRYSSIDYHRLHAGNRFLAVVHRLAASRSTSARITACSLGPVLWSRLDFPHQLQLRGVITRALHDVEVIVRKSTATVLHEIAELVYDSRCVPWLVLMCERAMTDPEPQLRSAAMTLTWHLAEHLPNAFLGDASKGSRYLRRLPSREDPIFADVYLLQCKLLPVATRLAEDRAPHVRLAVAAQCERLCDALGDHWSSVIIDVLVALLTDSDERVRGEAVLCVPRLADIVLLSSPPGVIPAGESSVLDALLPAAIKLQKDPCSSVRVALATAAGEMLTLLVGLQQAGESPLKDQQGGGMGGPVSIRYEKRHVDERLIPLVQRLLHDTDPEVTSSALRAVTNASRGSLKDVRPKFDAEDDDTISITSMQSQATSSSIEKKPVFLPVLSEEQVLRLLPTLSELANSKQWRVRQSAVEIVPALLGCTDKFETRAGIAQMCIRLTNDRVDAVRRTAAECLCLGGNGLGSHGEDVSGEWITALVIPQIQACAKNADYRQRLLCLKMVEVILINNVCPSKWKDESANAEGKNTPLRELLKLTLSLADDRIANVRLNVGRVLGTVIHVFGEDECRVIKYALLQQLKKEKSIEERRDRDVNFYATKCLERVKAKVYGEADASEESKRSESTIEVESERQMI